MTKIINKIRLGISSGDPAGIGPEIIIKAIKNFQNRHEQNTTKSQIKLTSPDIELTIFGNKYFFEKIDKDFLHNLAQSAIQFEEIKTSLALAEIKPGKISAKSGQLQLQYVETAIDFLKENKIDALVTGPITKAALKEANISFLDHTAILKNHFKREPITFLATPELRVVHVMRHMSLKKSIEALSREKIYETIINTNSALKNTFKISNPKLFIAGLNPHNSDNGLLGNEEKNLIFPAVEKANSEGINITGPIAPDSVFPLAIKDKIDAVIALYHDQGHIAIKMNNWEKSIGITAGLDIIRTSVDHGSALDIAEKNIANPTSLIEAIEEAKRLIAIRRY